MKHDIFISFKYHDKDGNETLDFRMASELEKKLSAIGFNPFFSKVSLQADGASNYKKAIDEALDDAKILILAVTSVENANSDWVRYEWDSFSNDILSGINPDGKIFVLVDSVPASSLPRALRQVQVFDYSQNQMDELISHVKNALGVPVLEPQGVQNQYIKPPAHKIASTYSYGDRGEKKRLEIQASLESKHDREYIEQLISKIDKEKIYVLDLGCSAGYVTSKVFSEMERVEMVVGIDKFEKCITDFNNEIGSEKFVGICLNAEAPDFSDALEDEMDRLGIESFDIVFSALCMHHLGDPKNVLKIIRRHMSKNGYIYIRSCDDGQDIAYPDENDYIPTLIEKTSALPGVSDRFHGRKMLEQLQRAGFREIRSINYCLDTIGRDADERYCLFCNSYLWRKNYFKRQLDNAPDVAENITNYSWALTALEELEELFNLPSFYYCYNIPICIARA